MARAGWALSWAAGLASVPLAGWAARSLGAGKVGAMTAALILAIHPLFGMESTMVRVYPLWVAAQLGRLGLLGRLVASPGEPPASRWVWWAWLALTALLPWLHYGSWPILVAEVIALGALVPEARRWLVAHVVAAVGSVPLWVLVGRWRSDVVPASEDAWGELGWFLSAGHEHLGPVVGLLVVGVAAVAWRAPSGWRVAYGAALASLAGVAVVALVARARLPIALLGLPGLVLGVVVGLGRWPRSGPWLQAALALGYLAWWPREVGPDLRPLRYPADINDGIRQAAVGWVARPRPLGVYPFAQLWVVRFHLLEAGLTPEIGSGGERLSVQGVELRGLRQPEEAVGEVAWMTCDRWPDRCEVIERVGPCVDLLRCSPTR